MRWVRARHLGPFRLDATRHAPLHGADGAAAAQHGAGARRRPPGRGRATRVAELTRAARTGAPAAPAAAASRRAGVCGHPVGRRHCTYRRRASRDRSRADGLLPDVARDHQRGVLRGSEGGAFPRHEPRRQLRAALSCRLDRRDAGDARTRGLHLQLRGLARRRPDRALRVERPEQPAGHDQVSASRQAERRADCGGQPLSRAGTAAVLDSVNRAQRVVGHRAGRPLVRRAHRRRPGVPHRGSA